MNKIINFFKKAKEGIAKKLVDWRWLNNFTAHFFPFGSDLNKSEIVRACIRTLADTTAKAVPSCQDERIERLLKYRPNEYMNGKDFLYKIRAHYELKNTAFIVIIRDELGNATGFYPMSYNSFTALRDEYGDIYIKFETATGNYVFSWSDLIVLRKDYNANDIAGDSNDPILNTLELVNTSNQSIANAVKSTSNLRGILQGNNSMVDPADQKKISDEFVKNYMGLNNEGGVAYLDASLDFKEVNLKPATTDIETMQEFRNNIFRYFGVNDEIITGKAKPEQMQSFYEMRIEPFLQALSLEMTSKVFTNRQIAFGNEITYQSSAIQFMSMADKLALKDYIDRGAMTPNTWCDIVGLPHVEGGDEAIRRLDTAPVGQVAKSVKNKKKKDDEGDEGNGEE